MKNLMCFIFSILINLLFTNAFAAIDPVIKIRGTKANSVFDGVDYYGLVPSGDSYTTIYNYYPVITFDNNSTVPTSAAKKFEWIILGGSAPSGTAVELVAVKWNNSKNYNNGVPTKTLRVKTTFTWTENGANKTKTIQSVRANDANEAQPIEVKYISEPATLTFNGSTVSNGNTLLYACGEVQKTLSLPAVVTDPNAPVTYFFTYPTGWSGPATSSVPSVTVNTHKNSAGVIKVEAKRNDTENFRTKIAINITRPLPTKPTINSPDILLCAPKTITATASNATSYNWVTTGGITANSNGNTNTAQLTGISDGTVEVSATSSVCGVTSAFSNSINVKRSAPLAAALLVTENGGGSPDFMCNGSGVTLLRRLRSLEQISARGQAVIPQIHS